MVDPQEIQGLIERIVTIFRPEKVILFGSYANNNPAQDSDVDLLVVMKFRGNSALKSAEILNAIDPLFPVDLIVRTPDQLRKRVELDDFFIKNILENGKVIYDNNPGQSK